MIAVALLLVAALFSYDRNDLASNRVPPNSETHNWIGPIGAHLASLLFAISGAGAFLVPVFLFMFGLAGWLEALAYLRQRWLWALLLFAVCMGTLDLYSDDLRLSINDESGRAGGVLGMAMNKVLFNHFGRVGATIIFGTCYLISLLSLTNIELGSWLRNLWQRRSESVEETADMSSEEKALARRAKELERQARQLEEQVEKSGLGADLQPVPEPTVRDLSVPQARGKNAAKTPTAPPEPADESKPVEEVIPAHEIARVSSEDILSKSATSLEGATEPAKNGEDEAPGPGDLPSVLPKTRLQPRKKPIAVASTPIIGNYQLPPFTL